MSQATLLSSNFFIHGFSTSSASAIESIALETISISASIFVLITKFHVKVKFGNILDKFFWVCFFIQVLINIMLLRVCV